MVFVFYDMYALFFLLKAKSVLVLSNTLVQTTTSWQTSAV